MGQHKFLLVDDSRVMRRMLQNTLRENGFEDSEFYEAVDGQAALEELARVDFGVDVIFCDLCMPNLDGIGLIQNLSEQGRLQSCPVIVLSGDIREERAREALDKGASRLVGKPYTVETVTGALSEVLAERGA